MSPDSTGRLEANTGVGHLPAEPTPARAARAGAVILYELLTGSTPIDPRKLREAA